MNGIVADTGRSPGSWVLRLGRVACSSLPRERLQWLGRIRLPTYSGGTAPGLHRLPFSAESEKLRARIAMKLSVGRNVVGGSSQVNVILTCSLVRPASLDAP